jgi:hypothetical protein
MDWEEGGGMVRGLGGGDSFLEGIVGFTGRVCWRWGLSSWVVFWFGLLLVYCLSGLLRLVMFVQFESL